jgi:hypothetical protein
VTAGGATEESVSAAESALGVDLPELLISLLRFSDGIVDATAEHQLVWPVAQIVTENLKAHRDPDLQLPQWLLGFGDDGAGDWFCSDLRGGTTSVIHWR